jgi:HSP20 family protein
MNTLIRWDPFHEVTSFRNMMERMFDGSMLSPAFEWEQPFAWNLALDVAETDDDFVVKASLPGMKPEDLEITYDSNVLTIKGEIKDEQEVDEKRYHLRERRFGSFSRSVTLPTTIKADAIDARFDAGVLTLHLPKAEEAKPKRIPVLSGASNGKRMIEGKVKEVARKN